MRLISASRAYSIASEWGSFLDANDPGCRLYGFHYGDGRPVSDQHRSDCLTYLRRIMAQGGVGSMSARSERDLRSLIRFLANCPLRPDAPAMVPQQCQQQQAKARPARGERRYVTVRDTETGEVHRVLTSVARVGVAVVIFTPSNRHRAGALGGMLVTHDDIRKAWVFNDETEARHMLMRNRAPGERVIRAELISDPAAV